MKRLLVSVFLLAFGLSAQSSFPVVQPQPEREIYGLTDVRLFKEFTRSEYKAEYGVEAPEFDPTRRPKTWFDSSVDLSDPDAFVHYSVIRVVDGNPKVCDIYMPAWEAASINLEPEPFPMGEKFQKRWEIPIRPLMPNEALVASVFDGWKIIRVDLKLKADQDAGKFTAEDRELLRKIAADVAKWR